MAVSLAAHLARLAALAVLCGAGLMPPGATAQEARATKSSGPFVQIAGTGGEIEAAGASVVITGNASRIDAAGARIDINATVTGPVRAAGADVAIAGGAAGSLNAAGGVVEVTGKYGDDAYIVGAVIRFDATTAGNVSLGGATIDIGSASDIAGALSAGGAEVTAGGRMSGPVHLSGSAVTFNGAAAGNVIVDAGQLVVGATATIGGDLVVRSHNDPVVADGATIAGRIIKEEPRHWSRIPLWLWKVLFALFMAAGAVVAAIVLLVVGRSAYEEAVGHAAFRPLSSGLIGIATLIVLPIAATVLFATVIGFSVGIALLFLLPFLLVAGHAVVAACIGVWIFDRSGGPRSIGRLLAFTIAGAVIIALVWLIPWVGGVIDFLALIVGLGAYLRTVGGRLRRDAAVAA